jgi:acetyl-CoA carboxylase carboxyltransferase component
MPIPELDPRDPEARIARLVDDGEFSFLVPRTNCGMVAVTALIKGNKVVIFASDATIKSGALGVDGSKIIVTAYKAAMGAQVPIIGIWHSGGARLSDGVASLDAFGEVFQTMISASGRIPQLSLVLGPTAGGGAYGPALTDVVVLAPTRTFSSVLRPGSITIKNEPPAVEGHAVTTPLSVQLVSPDDIEDERVHAADAPEYDLLVAYGIYSPNPVPISL